MTATINAKAKAVNALNTFISTMVKQGITWTKILKIVNEASYRNRGGLSKSLDAFGLCSIRRNNCFGNIK